jgi:hypothetical protein
VLQCPENHNNLIFQIKPRALEESVTVELEVDCDCSCEEPGSEVNYGTYSRVVDMRKSNFTIHMFIFIHPPARGNS